MNNIHCISIICFFWFLVDGICAMNVAMWGVVSIFNFTIHFFSSFPDANRNEILLYYLLYSNVLSSDLKSCSSFNGYSKYSIYQGSKINHFCSRESAVIKLYSYKVKITLRKLFLNFAICLIVFN